MKKTLIAGAASITLAAMPVMGVFAATSVIDEITANVSDTCTLNRTAGQGVYATTLLKDSVSENFATSTFTATCNFDPSGNDLEVTASFSSLDSGADSIPYLGTDLVAGTAGWTAFVGDRAATAVPLSNNGKLIDATAVDTSQVATVWYSVATDTNQNAGSYKGYATYTLAEN